MRATYHAPMLRTERRPPQTAEDHRALPDDVHAELVDGRLYVTPAPTPRHQRVLVNLVCALEGWVRRRRLGTILVAPVDVHVGGGRILQPDLLFVRAARSHVIGDTA